MNPEGSLQGEVWEGRDVIEEIPHSGERGRKGERKSKEKDERLEEGEEEKEEEERQETGRRPRRLVIGRAGYPGGKEASGAGINHKGSGIRQSWAGVLAGPLIGWVAWGMMLTFSKPLFPICKNG